MARIVPPLLATLFALVLTGAQSTPPQPGSAAMPLRYVGRPLPDPIAPDGGLPLAVGAQNYQVVRSTRLFPEISSEGLGWTFNHAPMLVHWKGKFYLEFITSPTDENGLPTEVVMADSSDGRTWSRPRMVFPQWNSFAGPSHPVRSQLHQRMGFFVASNGRLLVISHYGLWDNRQNHIFGGPGHVVREMRENGSLGPIYFVRFGEGWNESNAFYPFYKESSDAGFVAACNQLLANRLVTDQWFELEKGYPADAYAQIPGAYKPASQRKALSFFVRKDGKAVALWKKAWVATSGDEGRTWSVPVLASGVAQTFAKLWGQRTADGRYALAYDPQDQPPGHRWPLAVATSDDGITFNDLAAIHGEVPQRRYPGYAKDIGPQYVRGLENEDAPPGGDVWLTYSVNKEDIWVSRIPVPIHSVVSAAVNDTFEDTNPGAALKNWNIYSPLWAPVQIAEDNTAKNKTLRLEDGDPYDYARAIRVFPQTRRGTIAFRVQAEHSDRGRLEVELADDSGRVPIRLAWNEKNRLVASVAADTREVATFEDRQWMDCRIDVDTTRGKYSLAIDGRVLLSDAAFAESVEFLERISFRTGKRRTIFTEQTNFDVPSKDKSQAYYYNLPINPSTDHPAPSVSYYIDNVTTKTLTAQPGKNTD